MKGRIGYILGFAALIVVSTWIYVQRGDNGGAPGAGGEGGTSSGGGAVRPGGGETGGKETKRDRSGGRESGGRVAEREGAAVPYLSEAEARAESVALVEDAMQLTDPAKREAALEKIRAALGGSDEMAAYVALQAFVRIKELKMDRASFRDLVEPWLAAEDPGMRRTAWYAFAETERRPEDVARVRGLARDPSEVVRRSASHLMSLYEDGALTGASGDAVLGLLQREEKPVRREVLRGMWGATLSPKLEAKVIELSRSADSNEMHDALYFALSTSAKKSPTAVDRLIEFLADPDVVNNAGRAAWGLRQGVAKEDQARVAAAAMDLVENRRSGPLWSQAVELLGSYGSSEHKAPLERMLADPGLDQRARMSLQRVLEVVARR